MCNNQPCVFFHFLIRSNIFLVRKFFFLPWYASKVYLQEYKNFLHNIIFYCNIWLVPFQLALGDINFVH